MSSYTALPSHSSVGLPLYDNASSRTPTTSAPLPQQHTESTDTEKEGEKDRKGLLAETTEEEEDEGDVEEYMQPLNQRGEERQRTWIDKLPLRPRTLFLSIFSIAILVSLMLFFHPSRALSSLPSISHDSTSYYSGAPLSIGVYDPSSGQLSPNPLPEDATFGDVPFAKVGESWDENGWKPEWAGGDGGNKEFEKGLKEEEGMKWNGTSWWKRTVILVTLEGMRPDYLSEELTPNLLKMARSGVRAESLEPVFPSLSAPNQWSILTGLYPPSHGIVSNKFYSPSLDKSFDSLSSSAWDTAFPLGEPIYQSALRSSKLVATLHHPSIPPRLSTSPSRPTYWYPPTPHARASKTLSKLLSFLDLPLKKRPEFVIVNLEDIARDARKGGSQVTDDGKTDGVEKGVRRVDEFLGGLREGLRERGVEEITEVVVVGDTGLIDTSLDRIVYLDELLGDAFEQVEHRDGSSTFVGLRFASSFDTSSVLSTLRTASDEANSGFSFYTREEMPESWHFNENERIAPIWLIAKEGWLFSTKEEMEKNEGKLEEQAANGYDPTSSPSMRSIFISSGPFTSSLKEGTIKGFSNLEIYDFVANSLGLSEEMRAKNNATTGFWEELAK